jgi:acid phosphatase
MEWYRPNINHGQPMKGNMMRKNLLMGAAIAGLSGLGGGVAHADSDRDTYKDIQTVVVIYAENRSFDSLYGTFPGANGLSNAKPREFTQVDRDGHTVLSGLPAVWGGTRGNSGPVVSNQATTAGAPVAPVPVTEGQSATYLNTFNHPFNVASLYATQSALDTNPLQYTNRDLYHRFYENQMQINGGKSNAYAAWADSGGLTMGYFTHNDVDLPLWKWAKKYVLADNFFQAAFGGSYLNHQFLICSCAPIYPGDGTKPINPAAPTDPTKAPTPSVLNADGVTLTTSATSPASALNGPPAFVTSSSLTPAIKGVFYSVNTSQPPYPPSGNANATTPPQQSVLLASSGTTPPQTQATIGDLLSAAHINWAYYSGAWNFALANAPFASGTSAANPNFQYHHQPFNYYADFDPSTAAGTANRAAHLLDAGVISSPSVVPPSRFLTDIQNGTLPAVTFYKPHGTVNEHPGYANVSDGDTHIAAVLTALKASKQWKHMLVIVTYDEFGGWWDHVAPPKADMFGPGTRIPALITNIPSLYMTLNIFRYAAYRTSFAWK